MTLAYWSGFSNSMPAAQIARFLQELPDTVVLAGGRRLEPALHASGRRIVLAEAVPAGIPDDAIIVWERAFDAEGYETVAELKRRFPGRVTTAFELLSKALLFQAVGELIGYHQAKGNEARLVDIMSGATPEPWGYLGELDKLYPIAGKRVIEYGPLDGAMTATLLQLGAASVTGVEIRMTNVIKLLAAAHIFGWGDRFRLLIEDMHMVDASSTGRFDLAVAHGVYYHSIRPFHFLQNLATVADTLFIGGFVADPERLRSPLVELDHDGDVYRAQHYADKRQ